MKSCIQPGPKMCGDFYNCSHEKVVSNITLNFATYYKEPLSFLKKIILQVALPLQRGCAMLGASL